MIVYKRPNALTKSYNHYKTLSPPSAGARPLASWLWTPATQSAVFFFFRLKVRGIAVSRVIVAIHTYTYIYIYIYICVYTEKHRDVQMHTYLLFMHACRHAGMHV